MKKKKESDVSKGYKKFSHKQFGLSQKMKIR